MSSTGIGKKVRAKLMFVLVGYFLGVNSIKLKMKYIHRKSNKLNCLMIKTIQLCFTNALAYHSNNPEKNSLSFISLDPVK